MVLMDWRMPRLDGVQATARIRSQLPEVQVVVFSSAEGAGMGVIARQAGASALSPRAHRPSRSARPCWPPGADRHRPNHPLTAHSSLVTTYGAWEAWLAQRRRARRVAQFPELAAAEVKGAGT